ADRNFKGHLQSIRVSELGGRGWKKQADSCRLLLTNGQFDTVRIDAETLPYAAHQLCGFIEQMFCADISDEVTPAQDQTDEPTVLTTRESELLRLGAERLPASQIGARLVPSYTFLPTR
ncbi:MAG: hypothetical protein WBD34_23570, partial [Burkholderiaceae bacterium]